jgi:predicted nucleic acid-binding Zn ribbon protein
MDTQDQFSLEHLLFKERKCRSCGVIKDLLEDFYVIRKAKRYLPSSYSYECKDCTNKRITSNKNKKNSLVWEYPDW